MITTINATIRVKRDTTENWNERILFIPMSGEIVVYTDHSQINDEYGNSVLVPGIKIGDGTTYLIDLPFVGDDDRNEILQELKAHTQNSNAHVSDSDRSYWDEKMDCDISGEILILSPKIKIME